MLGNTPGKSLVEYKPDYCLYDLETTGISTYGDDVIEIAAVKVRGGVIVDEFCEFVNPGRPIPRAASAVNHITDRMVADAQTFDVVMKRFLDFIGDDVLAGHNIASFDMKFLYRDCEKYFGKVLTNDYIDTLRIAKKCFPEWRHRTLGILAEHYGLSTDGAHRALADCRMNQQVYELMFKELQGKKAIAEEGGRAQDLGKNKSVKETKGETSEKTCPFCGGAMKKRNGRYGEFYGCTSFPACRYTENIR